MTVFLLILQLLLIILPTITATLFFTSGNIALGFCWVGIGVMWLSSFVLNLKQGKFNE